MLTSSDSFDWRKYLELSRSLYEQSKVNRFVDCEAELRTAISRAYYSAFHMSLWFLRERSGSNFNSSRTGDDHAAVIFHLKNSGTRELQNAGRILGNLRNDRNKADYESSFQKKRVEKSVVRPVLLHKEAEKSIQNATEVVKIIEMASNGH
jgi:uncharacterized protein (UPF0332 family)